MNGREESVNSTHWGFVLVASARTQMTKCDGKPYSTRSYTPTDVKSNTEHVSDEELTSSGCSGSDVSLDMWCLEDDDLMDIMSY